MQAIAQPPQLFTSIVVLTHWPLHDVNPAGQPQEPPLHSCPGAQTTLQAPQSVSLVIKSPTQAVPFGLVHGV